VDGDCRGGPSPPTSPVPDELGTPGRDRQEELPRSAGTAEVGRDCRGRLRAGGGGRGVVGRPRQSPTSSALPVEIGRRSCRGGPELPRWTGTAEVARNCRGRPDAPRWTGTAELHRALPARRSSASSALPVEIGRRSCRGGPELPRSAGTAEVGCEREAGVEGWGATSPVLGEVGSSGRDRSEEVPRWAGGAEVERGERRAGVVAGRGCRCGRDRIGMWGKQTVYAASPLAETPGP